MYIIITSIPLGGGDGGVYMHSITNTPPLPSRLITFYQATFMQSMLNNNAAAVDSNTTAIGSIAAALDSNAAAVERIEAAVKSNAAAVEDNATDVDSNATIVEWMQLLQTAMQQF